MEFNSAEDVMNSFLKYAETHTDVPDKYRIYFKLYNMPTDVLDVQRIEKTAEAPPVNAYLLPKKKLCKVAGLVDLQKAAKLFETEHQKLNLTDRVEFSQNYVKIASNFNDAPYPACIIKYSGIPDTDMNNLKYLLELRTAAANNMGKTGAEYQKLSSILETKAPVDKEDQIKLAEYIHNIDVDHGFDKKRGLYDAFDMVFNKVAEDKEEPPQLSKAEIVAKYGEGILAEVENEDNSINYKRLDEIVRALPDVKAV